MKRMLSILLITLLFTANLTACQAAIPLSKIENTGWITVILQIDNPVMWLNGMEINMDEEGTAPIVRGDRTLIPVRAMIEALGGEVDWNSETQEVDLSMGTETIRLTIDSTTAYLNGEEYTLDVAPAVINDRTMIPVRFISESFGMSVNWEGESQRIIISKQLTGTEQLVSTASPATESPSLNIENEAEEEVMIQIRITVGAQEFKGVLYDNETVRAWLSQLPVTYDMSEMNGNEKYYYLSGNLPTDAIRPDRINTGDLMLYGSNCVVLFYQSFQTSYSYTRLGRIENPSGLQEALGTGSVQVGFKLQ